MPVVWVISCAQTPVPTLTAPAGAAPTASKQGGKPPADRQHGELEGWSPGKSPPSPEEKDANGGSGRPSVTMTPSGNVGTGFSF